MRKKIHNLFYLGNNYKVEFKKQIRMIIAFTLGFTIAFAWRETIFDLSESFVKWVSGIQASNPTSFLASIFITLLCIVLILFTARLLKDK